MHSAHITIAAFLASLTLGPAQGAEIFALSTDAQAIVLRSGSGAQTLVRVGQPLGIDDWVLRAVSADRIRIESPTARPGGSLTVELQRGDDVRAVLTAIPSEKGFGQVPIPVALPTSSEPPATDRDTP